MPSDISSRMSSISRYKGFRSEPQYMQKILLVYLLADMLVQILCFRVNVY